MSQGLQPEFGAALAVVLGEMHQSVQALLQALDAERKALDAGNIEALGVAGSCKQELMLRLERLDAERCQLARELTAVDAPSSPSWLAITQALRQCQQLNQRNGSIVGQRLRMVRQALAVLTGASADGSVYDRNGGLQSGAARAHALAAV